MTGAGSVEGPNPKRDDPPSDKEKEKKEKKEGRESQEEAIRKLPEDVRNGVRELQKRLEKLKKKAGTMQNNDAAEGLRRECSEVERELLDGLRGLNEGDRDVKQQQSLHERVDELLRGLSALDEKYEDHDRGPPPQRERVPSQPAGSEVLPALKSQQMKNALLSALNVAREDVETKADALQHKLQNPPKGMTAEGELDYYATLEDDYRFIVSRVSGAEAYAKKQLEEIKEQFGTEILRLADYEVARLKTELRWQDEGSAVEMDLPKEVVLQIMAMKQILSQSSLVPGVGGSLEKEMGNIGALKKSMKEVVAMEARREKLLRKKGEASGKLSELRAEVVKYIQELQEKQRGLSPDRGEDLYLRGKISETLKVLGEYEASIVVGITESPSEWKADGTFKVKTNPFTGIPHEVEAMPDGPEKEAACEKYENESMPEKNVGRLEREVLRAIRENKSEKGQIDARSFVGIATALAQRVHSDREWHAAMTVAINTLGKMQGERPRRGFPISRKKELELLPSERNDVFTDRYLKKELRNSGLTAVAESELTVKGDNNIYHLCAFLDENQKILLKGEDAIRAKEEKDAKKRVIMPINEGDVQSWLKAREILIKLRDNGRFAAVAELATIVQE
jgi:hypothetical protein